MIPAVANSLYRSTTDWDGPAYGSGHWVLHWVDSVDGPARYRFKTKREALRFAAIYGVALP